MAILVAGFRQTLFPIGVEIKKVASLSNAAGEK
jgi:hypothetical protein